MSQLLDQARQMQERLMSARQDLAETEATGTAGGGLVSATVDGTGELVAVSIDPAVVDPDDVETLADLVVAAVRDANAQARRIAGEQLGEGLGALGSAFGAPGGSEAPMGDVQGLLSSLGLTAGDEATGDEVAGTDEAETGNPGSAR